MAKNGIDIGDEIYDGFTESELVAMGHGGAKGMRNGARFSGAERRFNGPQNDDPSWVDWGRVRRGQLLWQQHLGRAFIALGGALLQGFSIARFAEVLVASGYSRSPEVAFLRFKDTAHAYTDWMRYPLDDPQSRARCAIYRVRCMHALARKMAARKRIFDREKGEGCGLSQYDMAEVQMGFCAVSLSIIKEEMGTAIPYGDIEDMVHAWRLIGYHLGILDAYNVCNSANEMSCILDEYLSFTPQRLSTVRESTHELQKTVVAGFGRYTPLGVNFWQGLLWSMQHARGWNVEYVRFKPLLGTPASARGILRLFRFGCVNRAFTSLIIAAREREIKRAPSPGTLKARLRIPMISWFVDTIIWRVVSIVAFAASSSLSVVLIALGALAILRRRGKKRCDHLLSEAAFRPL